jgi:hypothetical protein
VSEAIRPSVVRPSSESVLRSWDGEYFRLAIHGRVEAGSGSLGVPHPSELTWGPARGGMQEWYQWVIDALSPTYVRWR